MKSINKWDNTLVRRLTLLVVLPFTIPAMLLIGAMLGIAKAAMETAGAVRNAWKGVR